MTLTVYQFISPYSFFMAVLWFSLFILLSLLLRKFKVSIRYSVFPLILLLLLSIVRLFATIEVPGAIIVPMGTTYGDVLVFLQRPLFEATLMGLSISIGNILLLLWGVVSIILFVRYCINYHKSKRIMKTLATVRDNHSEELLKEVSGIDTLKIRVYRSSKVEVPMLVGLIHPVIYLPLLDFTEGELHAILSHEYFHYKNKDVLLLIVTNLTCILFWWNPLVYVLRKNVNMALELNNDFFAVTTMPKTTFANYLKSILKIAEKPAAASLINAAPATNSASFISNQGEVAERVDGMLLYQKPQKKQAWINAIFCIFMLICFCISYVFILQPDYGTAAAEAFLAQEEGSENAVFGDPPYLLENEDGTYSLYMNNEFAGIYEKGDEFIKGFPVKK